MKYIIYYGAISFITLFSLSALLVMGTVDGAYEVFTIFWTAIGATGGYFLRGLIDKKEINKGGD